MPYVCSESGVLVEPKLFASGDAKDAIIMWQAYVDLDYCCFADEIETIFGIPAEALIARIYRYIDGLSLKEPEWLNKEQGPFWAIKAANCEEGWESFRDRNGHVSELDHLRAYFWDEPLVDPDPSMCITHFKKKTGAKLDPKDHTMSTNQKVRFESHGYQYSES